MVEYLNQYAHENNMILSKNIIFLNFALNNFES